MSGNEGIVERALKCLGRGFDITSDFRLKYCKGDERLVVLNDTDTRDLAVPGFGSFPGVSVDIQCDKGDRTRHQSDVLTFNQMSEFFNSQCSVGGKIPSGEFNAAFGFDGGSWASDAAHTKALALDGFFIALFNLRIHRSPLLLSDVVRKAVPSSWDPRAVARFIETYGTHIIVGFSMGGQDVVFVRQDESSHVEQSDLKEHLKDLGDQMFTGACTLGPRLPNRDHRHKPPRAFKSFFDAPPVVLNPFFSATTKDGISVISARKGGEAGSSSHCEWLPTVPLKPDAILFSFIPITSLLTNIPGKGFLSHAINLYLRYKPPISELEYFLDFQAHRIWAPVHSDYPLGPLGNNRTKCSEETALHFNLMGPKLYVNTTQVKVGKRPLTGMRLYLEGVKCNRLAIHVQHLATTPMMLRNEIDDHTMWRGSDDISDDRYFEAVQRKKFSHVSTAPVCYDPSWAVGATGAAFIVTGAQLCVKKHGSKRVLHLRLLFSKATNSSVVKSHWARPGGPEDSQRSGFFSALTTSFSGGSADEEKKVPATVVIDSSVFPTGPPVPVQTQKLLKFVDITQLCRGPQDGPGHWLVTGARLDLERGKIGLHVKFSVLSSYAHGSGRSEEIVTETSYV